MSERQDHPPQQNDDQISVSRLPQEEELCFSAPPPEIEGYQILDKLGEAGQGQVWRAVQSSTGRQVALKVPRIGLLSSKKTLARFEREVEIAAHLRHPHIARIIDSGVRRGLYYYIMDLVEGTHLDQYVKDRGLSQRQILDLMKVVCEAVQHAHQNGVIHRDLKPSNIIVTKEGHPYVVDFGLAKSIGDCDPGVTVSLDGEAAGTPAYMSPEQAAGHMDKVDARTDVYSLGSILFTLLTGQHPHDLCGSHLDVLNRISQEEVVQPRKLTPKMDRDLEALLLKTLERDPDRRYLSAGGLAEDINNYLNGMPLSAARGSKIHQVRRFARRHRLAGIVTVSMSVVGMAAVVAIVTYMDATTQPTGRTHYQSQAASRPVANEDEANSLAENIRRVSPLDGEPHSIIALTYYQAGRWQESLDASQRAMDLYCAPRCFNLFLQAMAHWQLGHRREAVEQYKRATALMRQTKSPTSLDIDFCREATMLLRMQAAAPDFDWDLKGAKITGVTVMSNCRLSPGTRLDNLLSRNGLEDLDSDGLLEHDTDSRHMWLGRLGDDPWIEFDLGGIHMVDAIRAWNFNGQGQIGRGIKTADILVWTKERGWTRILDDIQFDEAPGRNGYDDPTVLPLGGTNAEKLRLADLKSFGDLEHIGLAKLEIFDVRNRLTSRPSPVDGADIGTTPTIDLQWTPTLGAVAYRVFLGDDPQNLNFLGKLQQGSLMQSARLEKRGWYCWKVDAVRADGSVAEGKLWSFSTGTLVGWWRLDEKNGGVATDSSGRGNHGRLIGDPQWRQEPSGGVLAFDGEDDYVYVGNGPDFDITSEITVACRIKVDRFTVPWQPIISKGNYAWRLQRAGYGRNIEFACTGTKVEGTGWGSVSGNRTVDDGQWHHIAAVYDGSNLYGYIDGRLDIATQCSGKINSRGDPVLIGACSNDALSAPGRKPWCGSIADVRVYSYALTPAEVEAVCAGGGPGPVPRRTWADASMKRLSRLPLDVKDWMNPASRIGFKTSHEPDPRVGAGFRGDRRVKTSQ